MRLILTEVANDRYKLRLHREITIILLIMSQHGRDFEKQGFSYMDDVPVKISEKYKPPKKYNLPVGFMQKFPTEIITEHYDFQLERNVLEKISEWRMIRTNAIEARRKRIEAEDKLIQEQEEKLKEQAASPTTTDNATDDDNATQSLDNSSSINTQEKAVQETPELAGTSSVNTSEEAVPNCQNAVPSVEGQMISPQSNQYAIPNNILTPTPYGPFLNQRKDYPQSPFNLSDFEADTSSPFDNMELKTINDMEELAHVLQPMSSSSKVSKEAASNNTPHYSYYGPNAVIHQGQPSNVQVSTSISSVQQLGSSEMKTLPHVNGITSYSLYGTVPRTQMQPVNQIKNADMHNVSYSAFDDRSYHYPMSSLHNSALPRCSAYDYYLGRPWDSKNPVVSPSISKLSQGFHSSKGNTSVSGSGVVTSVGQSYSRPTENMDNNNMYTFPVDSSYFIPQVPVVHSNDDKVTSSDSGGGLRASKSVPDIMKELESELKKLPAMEIYKRHNCNSTPSGQSIPKELENWSPWPNLDSPDSSPYAPSDSGPASSESRSTSLPGSLSSKYVSSLPNPFSELPPSSQRLVKHISEMGFSLPRVSRACQTLGEDDKKIVEFLLQCQSLEEKSYPGDLVEQSLISSNFNEEECINYMNLVGQLKDLGFSESQVVEALKINENDGDKALDYLVS